MEALAVGARDALGGQAAQRRLADDDRTTCALRLSGHERISGGQRARTSTTGLDHWTTAVDLAVLLP